MGQTLVGAICVVGVFELPCINHIKYLYILEGFYFLAEKFCCDYCSFRTYFIILRHKYLLLFYSKVNPDCF